MLIRLQKTIVDDLETLFRFQLDKDANYMAAFTAKNYEDKEAYLRKFRKLLQEPSINMFTIILDKEICGSVAKFELEGQAEITYWIGRSYWGKGVATNALKQFLKSENTRPLRARVAYNNTGSIRVLEKTGFKMTGKDKGFANARGAEIEEFIFFLDK